MNKPRMTPIGRVPAYHSCISGSRSTPRSAASRSKASLKRRLRCSKAVVIAGPHRRVRDLPYDARLAAGASGYAFYRFLSKLMTLYDSAVFSIFDVAYSILLILL